MTFAAQELRLISALVVILGLGLFLALPFVLSIGSVVFLPLVTAMMLTIILSPLADKLRIVGAAQRARLDAGADRADRRVDPGAMLIFQPAVTLFDSLPAILGKLGDRICRASAAVLLARPGESPDRRDHRPVAGRRS